MKRRRFTSNPRDWRRSTTSEAHTTDTAPQKEASRRENRREGRLESVRVSCPRTWIERQARFSYVRANWTKRGQVTSSPMEEHDSTAGSEEECHSTAVYEEIVPKSEGDACSDVDSYTEYLPSPVPEFNLETDSEEDDWPLGSGNSLILPSHMYKETMEKVEFGKIRLEVLEGRLEQLRRLERGEVRSATKESKDGRPPSHAYQAILDSAARVKELSRQLRAVQLHSTNRRATLLERLRASQEHHRHALQDLTELKAEVVAAESIFHSRIQVWESLLQQKRDKKWELKLALDSANKSS